MTQTTIPALTDQQAKALVSVLIEATDLAWARRDMHSTLANANGEAAGLHSLCELLAAANNPEHAAEGVRLRAVCQNLIEQNEKDFATDTELKKK